MSSSFCLWRYWERVLSSCFSVVWKLLEEYVKRFMVESFLVVLLRRQRGHLKVCSNSVLFDPQENSYPILRVSVKEVPLYLVFGQWKCNSNQYMTWCSNFNIESFCSFLSVLTLSLFSIEQLNMYCGSFSAVFLRCKMTEKNKNSCALPYPIWCVCVCVWNYMYKLPLFSIMKSIVCSLFSKGIHEYCSDVSVCVRE